MLTLQITLSKRDFLSKIIDFFAGFLLDTQKTPPDAGVKLTL